MDLFRLFLIEQDNQAAPWFEKIPMPEMVGNALMVCRNIGGQKLQESYGDVHPGRGFPISQPAANMLSIVPNRTVGKEKAVSNMGEAVYAFDWLVHRGLFEALQIRKKMAKNATEALRTVMPNFDQVFGDEVTEDVVYSKEAHAAIPELKRWFESIKPSEMEPKSMIKFPSGGGNFHRLSLEDINGIVDLLSKQSKINFEKLTYGGTGGFLEWIENGPWAEKIGTENKDQPWRTRHGISLHDAKVVKDPETGEAAYQFGGILSPIRNIEGSYQKKLRTFIQGIFATTSQQIQNKINDKIKSGDITPEQEEFLNHAVDLYKSKSTLKIDASYAQSRGLEQTANAEYETDEGAEFAAHLIIIRAAIDMRVQINNYLKDMPDVREELQNYVPKTALSPRAQQAVEYIKDKFGIQGKDKKTPVGIDLKNILKDQTTEKDVPDRYKVYGIESDKDFFKSGKAQIKRGDHKHQSSISGFGAKYLKYLINDRGVSSEELMRKYIGRELDSGKLDTGKVQNLEGAIKNELETQLAQIGEMEIPKSTVYDPNQSFGNIVGKSDRHTVDFDQIQSLIKGGYVFQSSDKDKDKDPVRNTIEGARRGRLVYGDKKIELSRPDSVQDGKEVPWEIWDSPDNGKPVKGFNADIPLLVPNQKQRYGGNRYVTHKVGSDALDINQSYNDIVKNPHSFGYGIGGMPPSMQAHLKDRAMSAIRSGRTNAWDAVFVGHTEDSLARDVSSIILQNLTGAILKYGDLNDTNFIDRTVLNQLKSKNTGLPGLEDSNQIVFWIDRMKESIKDGETPKIVFSDDFSVENWQKRPGQMPEAVHNAFLVSGALYRSSFGFRELRRLEGNNKEQQLAQVKGKDGDAMSIDGSLTNNDVDADERLDRHADGRMDKYISAQDDTRSTSSMRKRLDLRHGTGLAGDEMDLNAAPTIKKNLIRSKRNEKDYSYIQSYKDQSSNLGDTKTSEFKNKYFVDAINNIPNRTATPQVKGRLDAIADSVYEKMKDMVASFPAKVTANDTKDLVSFVKDVGLALERKYKNSGDDFNVMPLVYSALGKYQIPIVGDAKKLANSETQPQQVTQPQQQTPVQTQSYTTATSAPAQTAPAPTVRQGLGDFMRRKKEEPEKREWQSFRTRVLQKKLSEMAGGDAVGTGEKFTGNWWGAIGDPMGVSIEGDVEDRQSNPDGTKSKKKKKK